MTDQQYLYQGYTLIDITPTGVISYLPQNELKRNQQRNWETILQCISLRATPVQIRLPIESTVSDLEILKFGDFYRGKNQKFWTWVWGTETAEVYDLPNKPLGGLLQDFEQVPVVTGLTETAKFMLPIFYPYGSIKNIWIEKYIQ